MDDYRNANTLVYIDDENNPPENLHPVHHTLLLVFACLGLVGNSLAAVVWGSLVTPRSGAFYLATLSVADALLCLSLIVLKIYEGKSTATCTMYIVDELQTIISFISRHVTVLVGVQRWIVMSRPLSAARLCSIRRQIIALVCLLLPLLGITVFGFYARWMMYLFCTGYGEKEDMVYLQEINEYLIFIWQTVIFICLLIVSSRVLYSTCVIHPMQTSSVNVTWHQNLEQRMITIYLCLAACSLVEISTSLIYVLYLIEIIHNQLSFNITMYVLQWAATLNSVINFVFYSCLGREFRERISSTCTRIIH